MQKIRPCLWFDGRVDEAIGLYTSVFPDTEVLESSRYPEGTPHPGKPGEVLMAVIRLAGQEVALLNGGPGFPQSPAFSFMVRCEGQAEVDRYWDALVEGGRPQQCGWLADRFGVHWQIVPVGLDRLLGDPDPARAQRAMTEMLSQVKIDIAAIERAAGQAGG